MMSQILSLILIFSLYAQAQETTTAPSTVAVEEPSSTYETTVRSASFQSTSKIIIDEETIKKSKAPNIASLLQTQANMTIATGNLQPNTVYLRGGDSSHILVLVDGLPFFDATTPQRTFNIDNFDIKTIRRIEVLKGPQSVLYGGQALTGVIKIETFPLELNDKVKAVAEAGNLNYGKVSVAGMTANEAKDFAAMARISALKKSNLSPLKTSDFKYPTRVTGGDVSVLSRGDLTSFLKVSQISEQTSIANFSQATYTPVDTQDYILRSRASSASGGLSLPNSVLRPRLVFGYQNGLKTYEHPTIANLHYGSDLINTRLEADVVNDEASNLLVGMSYQKERMVFRDNFVESVDAFNEYRGIFGKWTHDFGSLLGYEIGLRSDHINHQDRADSFQLGLTLVEKLKLEYATGYKTASLFQLSGQYGNPDLEAEKSRTYSLTYEEKGDSDNFSLTLFDTSFDNLIVFRSLGMGLGKYYNVSRAQTRGIETSYSVVNEDRLRGLLNFGYQEPRDVTNAKWLARRPLVTASFGVSKDWEKDSVGAELVYTGDRTDRGATAAVDKQLSSRTVLNLNYTYKMADSFSVYARGNNVTDQKFEQSSGFYDEGFFGLVGLEFQN